MNSKMMRVARFLPLAFYVAGVVYRCLLHPSVDTILTTLAISLPFTLTMPLATVFIGAKPRRRRTYVIGTALSALGVCAMIGTVAFFVVFWMSIGLHNNGETAMVTGEVITTLLLLLRSGLERTWMLSWGSLVAMILLIVCAVAAPKTADS